MSNLGSGIFLLVVSFVIQLSPVTHAQERSLTDIELSKIIELQNRLLIEGKHWSEEELTRQAQEIVSRYENFLLDNPKDINALLLFGKFLRKTGLHENAVSLFLEADQINPGIAVVKQELGNFLVETGKPIEAFPFFLLTTRLAPAEPIYHYNLGNFIFLFHNELLGIEESEKLGALMHQSFKEAAILDPENFDYQLRFAQSFFDFEHNLQEEAIASWDILLEEFGERSPKEIDYIKLNKAKLLLELGRNQEALKILRSVNSKTMQKEKRKILEEATLRGERKVKKSSLMQRNFYNKFHEEDSYSFPIDPNLGRIKRITSKLRQETMLKDLQHDIAKARILSNGKISLELSYKSLSTDN